MLTEDQRQYFFTCPIEPWLAELHARMQEAAAVPTTTVNLSYTHPRGFFPSPIVRRPAIREALKGWQYDRTERPIQPTPNHYFMPPGVPWEMLEWCDLTPFQEEVARRHKEAWDAGHFIDIGGEHGQKWIPEAADLTPFHPRGGIPPTIVTRLSRRSDKAWRRSVEEKIRELNGDANKADALAKTLTDKAEAVASKNEGTGDPTKCLAGAEEQRQKAAECRRYAAWLEQELGNSAS